MTKEEVIALAREAGWQYADGDAGYDPLWRFAALIKDHITWSDIHSCHPGCTKPPCVAMRKAVEAEREDCAKVCEGRISGAVQSNEWWAGFREAMSQCAAAIRSRT